MVSHLSNGAVRASLTSTSRIYCAALASPSVPISVPASRGLTPRRPHSSRTSRYSSYASTHPTISVAQSTILTTSPSRSRSSASLRSYATASEPQLPQDIAVLGGGLTGLTTAYYLTRFHPDAKITIYEAADRLGGWIDTERVDVKTQQGNTATVTFERGARAVSPQTSLPRWEDFVLYDLPNDLFAVRKDNPVLGKRYIYYPDHLVELPGPPSVEKAPLRRIFDLLRIGYQVLTEPIFKGAFSAGKNVYARSAELQTKRGKGDVNVTEDIAIADCKDVSTGQFLADVFGRPDLVHNLMSAMYHGIWGGDVWKLSAAETTMQSLFLQLQNFGMGLQPFKLHDVESAKDILARNTAISEQELREAYGPQVGYLGFHDGFSTLTDAMVNKLKGNPNVAIKKSTPVTAVQYGKDDGKATVTSAATGSLKYDKVISSLYGGTLAKLTGDALPALKNSTAVTIQIVNLWYPNPHLTARHPGFGYLIPQSVPVEKNPHAALGVIFDSDREAAAGSPEYTSAPGTKLTVMLGGHYWDYLEPDSWPDAKEAVAMAKDTVERQLGIPTTEPVFVSTKICRECIPQHLVGHRARMAQAHTELYNSFRGTLAVVGSSYTSPGVLPSLKAARDIALKVAGQGYRSSDSGQMSNMAHVGETGLGRFYNRNEKIYFMPAQDMTLLREPKKRGL